MQTLLSHYYRPDDPAEITEAALRDWVRDLISFPREAITAATDAYRRDQPRQRPTPAAIRKRCIDYVEARKPSQPREAEGDITRLSHDEAALLHESVLPTARNWVDTKPGLCVQGAKTLAFWGMRISLEDAQRIRRDWMVVMPSHLVSQPQRYEAWLREIAGQEQPEPA